MSMFDSEGGFDMQGLLAQAQAMQQQLSNAQAELGAKAVVGSSGGGLVEVTMTGVGDVVGVNISPQVCDPNDVETLGDLIVAAIRDATAKAQSLAAATMPAMPEIPF